MARPSRWASPSSTSASRFSTRLKTTSAFASFACSITRFTSEGWRTPPKIRTRHGLRNWSITARTAFAPVSPVPSDTTKISPKRSRTGSAPVFAAATCIPLSEAKRSAGSLPDRNRGCDEPRFAHEANGARDGSASRAPVRLGL